MYNENGDVMLVSMKNILIERPVFQFNINNLEWTKAILEEVNELKNPVILGVSENAIKYMGGYKVVSQIVKSLIEELKIKVPVVLHLDHGKSIESCKKALEAGFTSVMIDASNYSLEENIKITKQVVELAQKYNASTEAEIGSINGNYTNINDVLKIVWETKIDALAPAVGNIHGIYKKKPKLNYELIKEIKNKTNIPLVLHGGSNLPDEILKQLIESGINKININTDLQIAWAKGIKKYLKSNKKEYDPRKILEPGSEEIKKVVKNKIAILPK